MQNEKYVEGYKESEAFVVAENLRRAIALNDYEIMRSRYRLLIGLALKAIKNKHP